MPLEVGGRTPLGSDYDRGAAYAPGEVRVNPRFDLTELLRAWPEDPGRMTVRFLRSDDGRVLLQRRVPLGVFQMEASGRPDGLRPGGHESVLADFRTRDRRAMDALGADELDAAEQEGAQFMHRAIAMAAMGELEAVIRDADHVRRLADCVNAGSGSPRSQVLAHLLVRATLLAVRAEVVRALRQHGAGRAIEAIDRGLADLESMLERNGAIEPIDSSGAEALRALRAVLMPKLPSSQREELRERLRAAILAENFELAAILRNELRQIGP